MNSPSETELRVRRDDRSIIRSSERSGDGVLKLLTEYRKVRCRSEYRSVQCWPVNPFNSLHNLHISWQHSSPASRSLTKFLESLRSLAGTAVEI
jgi:hypothetical protein